MTVRARRGDEGCGCVPMLTGLMYSLSSCLYALNSCVWPGSAKNARLTATHERNPQQGV